MADFNWRCPVCGATYIPAPGLPPALRDAEHAAWRERHEAGDHDDEGAR